MTHIRWRAVLSNGLLAEENEGEWAVEPGERKPWVRLCEFAVNEGLHLTSLSICVDEREIVLPTLNGYSFDKTLWKPTHYSLQYILEVTDLLGAGNTTHFIDAAAHFPFGTVHYIIDATDSFNSWIVVSAKDEERLAPSPVRENGNN